MAKKSERMLTIKQVAEITGASQSSIRVWLSNDDERKRRFPNAIKERPPAGPGYWLIPESDIGGYSNPGQGRPRKAEPKRKRKSQSIS
jgi:hypothetical protein